MKIIIDEFYANKEVIAYMHYKLQLSNRQIKKLKYNRGIRVNRECVTVRYMMSYGDVLELDLEDEAIVKNLLNENVAVGKNFAQFNNSIISEDLPLNVVYEDEYMIAINKPPNMPTHPSHNHITDTLSNATALYYAKHYDNLPFIFRPVNRLDRNTSGLVLLAKSQYAASKLSDLLASGKIEKSYLSIVNGTIKPNNGTIDTYIRRKPGSSMLREVVQTNDGDSLHAVTSFSCVARSKEVTMIKVYPQTGRTHQIRVHLAHIGHPVYGDDLYGMPALDMPRQALHASELKFIHPFNNNCIEISAPIPQDIINLIGLKFDNYDKTNS